MKLLRDVTQYCIKVDYYHWSDEKGEYTIPLFLSIDTETKAKDGTSVNLIIFKENICDCLRVFDTEKKAKEYLKNHTTGCSVCYENPRVVKIKYNFEENRWEEY